MQNGNEQVLRKGWIVFLKLQLIQRKNAVEQLNLTIKTRGSILEVECCSMQKDQGVDR